MVFEQIRRYAIYTVSGSYYLIEDHKHLIGKPTFKMSQMGWDKNTQEIIALDMGRDTDSIPVPKNINHWKGWRIVIGMEKGKGPGEVKGFPGWYKVYRTNFVDKVIEFK